MRLPRTPRDDSELRDPVQWQGRTFDRQIQFDPLSVTYPIMPMLAAEGISTPRSYTWSSYVVTDQGREGACVGHAVAGELACRPQVVEGVDNRYAHQLYREAQKVDEWPGEAYEGTSVLAGVKVARSRGFFREYRWAFGAEDLAVAVSRTGPAVLGIEWREGMYKPEMEGGRAWVKVEGDVVGGHAILCTGFNVGLNAFELQNSWGLGWGVQGRAWIGMGDMEDLLARRGEACILVRR